MTVNRNPKKMRPYDEPPKPRRSLIPGGPDSAATGFLVAAAVWLVIATGIGALGIFMRFVEFIWSVPLGVFDLSFQLELRRVEYAFVNATVFGWLTNAGFAAIAFMVPRLVGRPLAAEKLVNVALAIWNLSLLGGVAALYVLDLGPNAPLGAIPWLIDGGLATAALIVTASFLGTVGAAIARAYVSTWFAGVALLGLLGLVGLNATIGLAELFIEIPDLTVALISAFVDRAITTVWLLGMAFAVLYYVVPRAAGRPLASGGLAMLAWVTWLAFAPLSALGVLVDPSVPFLFTSLGVVATMSLFLPVALTVINLAQTMSGRWSLLFKPTTAAFAAVSVAFLTAVALLQAIGSVASVRAFVGGTEWVDGVFIWSAYGAFTFAAFAFADHAMPRIMRREWSGQGLAGAALWLVFAGSTVAGVALMGGGMAEGSFIAAGATPDDIFWGLVGYRAVAFGGLGLVALGSLALLVNLFLMYTSGRPVEYVVPGQSAPAAAGH